MPSILTTTVGSYPLPEWLAAARSETALIDATRVVFDTQRQAGIDLPTDGELYRFDINHPDTNGMIDYFVGAMSGARRRLGRREREQFAAQRAMQFRAKPAAVVEGPLAEGEMDLVADCRRAADVAGGPFKFTVTSPYMLARTLLDKFYGDFELLLMAVAEVLAAQVVGLPCDCIQVDEANIPGQPGDGPIAARAINRVLDAIGNTATRAVHFCFGNYGGQVIQQGTWAALIDFLNALHAEHFVLELAHRPPEDLLALKDVDPRIGLGIGVIDIKVNDVETPEEVARRIESAARILGPERIAYVHPDCGFWMLKRSVADRKLRALVRGRDLFLG
jgi:5-methyltetrahydropteroyltriglutamate--homocysteine methyltransferase